MKLVCVMCGWKNPNTPDGYYPGVGGICWDHALYLGLERIEHRPLTDEEAEELRRAVGPA
jgi:hypothetical protein